MKNKQKIYISVFVVLLVVIVDILAYLIPIFLGENEAKKVLLDTQKIEQSIIDKTTE